MLEYGLKIWSNNTEWFDEAIERHRRGEFDFVEVYSNSTVPHDYQALQKLKQMPVPAVHMGRLDKAGFHIFFLSEEQKPAWQMTVDLADFFAAERIVAHPATTHTRETFWENIAKLNDKRVVIESMPVVSPLGGPDRVFGVTPADLIDINKKTEVIVDIEKSIKAAVYFGQDYKDFMTNILDKLRPTYFHISGCSLDTPVDEHGNLWDAGFDVTWVKHQLESLAKDKDVYIVFETPKEGAGLSNDIQNISYFRQIK